MNVNIEPWQIKNWEHLTQLSIKNSLPASLLLWGQKGLGLQHFAEQFSAWLLCEARSIVNSLSPYPCGKCVACQWIAAGTHPDRLIITPESNSTTIKVDAIREIHAFSEKKSHRGQCRVMLISPAEAMNVSAANALLKILEEPFEDTFFLLVSHNLSALLPTILSRCQKVYFPPLDKSEFIAAMERQNTPSEMIEPLYDLSHGEPLAYPTLKLQEVAVQTQQKINTLMDNWLAKKISPMEIAEQIKIIEKESHMEFESLLNIIVGWAYQQIIDQKKLSHELYLFYDKLLIIKKHSQKAVPINQTLWLEDLFFTLE